ncbi:MAG: hypothetical protein L6300_06480 [Syntrophaceae bacterium]|nr:hypothetical protein [Syntrophaceae bacterium]
MLHGNESKVIILDVDGAVIQQKRLLAKHHPTVIPLQEKSEALRYWCRIEEMERLRQLIVSFVGTVKGKVIFYGSGDYHHLACLGISLIEEPLTIIHFDNHADFWRSPHHGYIHFGDWVVWAVKLPHVCKVIQLGIDGDLGFGTSRSLPVGPVTHEMSLLCTGKVEVYPNSMRRSILVGRIRATLPCVEFEPGLLTTRATWKNLRDHGGIEAMLERILPTLPTEAVYLTIDKDVLRESDNFAAYPGQQGTLTLNELLAAISLIGKRKRILGADVCGDGSYSAARGCLLKRLVARLKDSAIPPGAFSSQENISLNEGVNLKILERLMEV